ncbi:GPR1/FUN34/yaaH family protein [Methanococcus vannielii SB]|uniref:GPR1/FUN34/yaaH family protein n=1 Tax=Methanococcus vannielii (strain ATCC 35089 / DSM 1224 / JCM 13029 / OCM 148 / SB) TaxID=406327 RepID=A6URY2_METVS|nr:GPR1/FUN34/YaaH family transporter [Methanococcus vannielii]ABR55254.1 GPR1/FUN34/yaaH family protein [Methanococcus vannielii SB]
MQEQNTAIRDTTANPAPLGLMGFGITTVLLNLHNVGLFDIGSMILAMGIFYGGLSQVIVGIMEWKKGNTFGTLAFTSYGLFWLSLVGILVMPKLGIANPSSPTEMAFYLAMWGIFTLGMFFGTFKANRALQFVFGSLTLLFFLLAAGDITGSSQITTIAGVVGIICGSSAIYTGFAEVLNETYKKTVLPLFSVK